MATRIAVIDADKDRALLIVDGLRAADDFEISVIGDHSNLAARLAAIDPDVVLIDLESPSRDVLDAVARASGPLDRPVALFVDRSEDGMMRSAIDAGVSAYIVDGLKKERLRSILEVAIARFHASARLRAELDATKTALQERKTIDRAKGVLMRAKGVSEDEAYALLRSAAMAQNRKIAEIAQSILTASELLG